MGERAGLAVWLQRGSLSEKLFVVDVRPHGQETEWRYRPAVHHQAAHTSVSRDREERSGIVAAASV